MKKTTLFGHPLLATIIAATMAARQSATAAEAGASPQRPNPFTCDGNCAVFPVSHDHDLGDLGDLSKTRDELFNPFDPEFVNQIMGNFVLQGEPGFTIVGLDFGGDDVVTTFQPEQIKQPTTVVEHMPDGSILLDMHGVLIRNPVVSKPLSLPTFGQGARFYATEGISDKDGTRFVNVSRTFAAALSTINLSTANEWHIFEIDPKKTKFNQTTNDDGDYLWTSPDVPRVYGVIKDQSGRPIAV